MADLKNWQPQASINSWPLAHEVYLFGHWGRRKEMQQAFQKLMDTKNQVDADLTPILVIAYLGMNDNEKAIALLEEAYRQRSNALTLLKVDPVYDPLRSDPRFQELMRRVGLAQ